MDRFYDHVMDDELLAHYFAGVDLRRQKAHLRAFLATAVGGPERYEGRDMASAHARLAVTDEAFDHVVGHLVTTLTGLGVAPKTIGAIGGGSPRSGSRSSGRKGPRRKDEGRE